MENQEYQVMVHLIEARSIEPVDSNHSADPLCSVEIGPASRLIQWTETKSQTLNPVWEAQFVFDQVLLSSTAFESEKLSIKVYSRARFVRNKLVGSYEFTLNNIYRQKNHQYHRQWVSLSRPKTRFKLTGHLKLSCYVIRSADPPPPLGLPDQPQEGNVLSDPATTGEVNQVLYAFIYRADNILQNQNASFLASLRPYVSVRFNGTVLHTRALPTNAPTWNARFEVPFVMPLRSDSIEVQLWNSIPTRPDVLIAQRTFNFFGVGLNHSAFGPRWLNLYSDVASAQTSMLGRIKDSLYQMAASEFVGRLLVRLSAAEPPRGGCQVGTSVCLPTVDPEVVEMTVLLVLYAVTQLPVQGGQVRVQLAFGDQTSYSKWVTGKNGEFRWRETLPPLQFLCPADLSQAPDIVISLFHKAASSRKVAFERIPLVAFCAACPRHKHRDLYVVNGRYYGNGTPQKQQTTDKARVRQGHDNASRATEGKAQPTVDGAPQASHNKVQQSSGKQHTAEEPQMALWVPQWRLLEHSVLRKSNTQAGSLLCSVSVGRPTSQWAPHSTPQPIAARNRTFQLQAHVYQGAGFHGLAGAGKFFLVMAFAGKHVRTKANSSPFPFWLEKLQLQVKIDKKYCPVLTLTLFHEAAIGGRTPIGRCLVKPDDLLSGRLRVVQRFPLQRIGAKREAAREASSEADLLGSGKQTEHAHGLHHSDQLPYVLAAFNLCLPTDKAAARLGELDMTVQDYKIEFTGISVSHLLAQGKARELRLEVSVVGPSPQSEGNASKQLSTTVACGSRGGRLLHNVVFDHILLPTIHPMGVPLLLKLFCKKELLGACYFPVMKFQKTGTGVHDTNNVRLYGHTRSAPQQRQGESSGLRRRRPSPESDPCEPSDSRLLRLGINDLNVVSSSLPTSRPTKPRRPSSQHVVDHSLGEGGIIPHLFWLTKRSTSVWSAWSAPTPVGQVKAVVTLTRKAVPSGGGNQAKEELGGGKEDQHQELLERLEKCYDTDFIARVNLKRGVHLVPRSRLLRANHISAYVVARNCVGPGQTISPREESDDPLNPDLYQVVELRTVLPDTSLLELSVFDRVLDKLGVDNLVGQATEDLELLLLKNLTAKTFFGADHLLPLVNKSSFTSQGALELSIDLLPEKTARQYPARNLVPPSRTPFELRMVIWDTKSVTDPRHPMKDVAQKLGVTVNFEGKKGGDITEHTDETAWSSSAEETVPWNYRFVFPVLLPAKVPRLKLTMWNVGVLGESKAIGAVLLNLEPIFKRALLETVSRGVPAKQQMLNFTHPDCPGQSLGQVCVEVSVVSQLEARSMRVGKGRNEPNQHPYLPPPRGRKLPPWAVGSKALGVLGSLKFFRKVLMVGLLFPLVCILAYFLMLNAK